jgi:(E)-4-hydroxy-3-methylbut-2-enyl-diphosphate synthase
MIARRKSRPIRIGQVVVGGNAPIVVQSMTKTDTRDAEATIEQIKGMEECRCELVRVAVPDRKAAEALSRIKNGISIPLIADIHLDYRLALLSLEAGCDGLRLNPGNIGNKERVAMVARAARERSVPIRIGVNAGSLPQDFLPQATPAERMVALAIEQVALLESLDFDLIKISLKAFDVPTTIEAYKEIAQKVDYPLHLGITEAGTSRKGVIRSAVGIGTLLYLGIGDTLRVSLSAHPREEVITAYEILSSLDLRQDEPVLVSCPSCGRAEVDVIGLAEAVQDYLDKVKKPLKVAVMGCIVNGPGEAREADIGLACGRGRGVIFRKGDIVRTVEEEDFFDALRKEIDDW